MVQRADGGDLMRKLLETMLPSVVDAQGTANMLGCAVGDSETEAFWTEFLRSLRDRGLGGVQLVNSDSHRV